VKENNNLSISRQINPTLLYEIVVFAASCYLVMLSLSSTANTVLAQEGDDSSITRPSIPTNTNFRFAAAGDWGCTEDTTNTVNNILDKNPQLVLGLGDYTYHGDPLDCWFDIIEPIDNIMKISIGNHEVSDLEELMDHFGLTEQYYSFDYQNVHFISLGTEEEYLDMSNVKAQEQLAFVKSDLEKASTNPNTDWIIPFFHRIMYPNCECGIVDLYDHNLVDVYHPIFEKYGVNLVLQAHAHTYERTYPLKFNYEDSEEPILTSKDLSNYRSTDGLVIATVGTGGVFSTRLYSPSELTAVQKTDLFGFLNVDVSSDGTTLIGTFYDNNGGGQIIDQFTITKSSSLPTEEDEDDDQIAVEEESENESPTESGEEEEEPVVAFDEQNGNEEFSEGNEEEEIEDDVDVFGFDDGNDITLGS
jgi:Calcineurin-like phosphoesterase